MITKVCKKEIHVEAEKVKQIMDYSNYWDQPKIIRTLKYYELRYSHIKDKLLPVGNVLDVGGGSGQFMAYMLNLDRKEFYRVTIMDISDSGLKQAKGFRFNTIKGDVEQSFVFREKMFDTIFCFEVMEHIDNYASMLLEIKNCLSLNGTFYIAVPNMPSDGIHHKRRWYPNEVIDEVRKYFAIDQIYRVPAFIEKPLCRQGSILQKLLEKIMYRLPFNLKWFIANHYDKMTMITIIKANKITSSGYLK